MALSAYYQENSNHLTPWEPLRPSGYHSIHSWKDRLVDFASEYKDGKSVRMVATYRDRDEILGVCAFTNISRGAFQACNLCYSIALASTGKGLMTEIVGAATDYVFEKLKLHRIMANYIPENAASERILEKFGFEKEGLARSYLKIQGV